MYGMIYDVLQDIHDDDKKHVVMMCELDGGMFYDTAFLKDV